MAHDFTLVYEGLCDILLRVTEREAASILAGAALVSIVNDVHPSGESSHLREAPPPGGTLDEYGCRRPAQSQIGCNELGAFAFQQINEMTECQRRLIE